MSCTVSAISLRTHESNSRTHRLLLFCFFCIFSFHTNFVHTYHCIDAYKIALCAKTLKKITDDKTIRWKKGIYQHFVSWANEFCSISDHLLCGCASFFIWCSEVMKWFYKVGAIFNMLSTFLKGYSKCTRIQWNRFSFCGELRIADSFKSIVTFCLIFADFSFFIDAFPTT